MNKFEKRLTDLMGILFTLVCILSIVLLYLTVKNNTLIKHKEQATLNYYESVETLLDSLYIDCGDTIFETDAGAKYLESKYKFDSLFIDNDRRN